MEICQKDVDRLTKIQNLFLNMLLGVYKCPAMLMYWDLKILTVPLRILKMKLLLFHHISCLPTSTLAAQVMTIQQQLSLPGLNLEVKNWLMQHQIINVAHYTKKEWKNLVNGKIHDDNRKFLISWSKKYKKIDTLSLECEDYKMKDYFYELTLSDSRLKFRERSGCLNTCRVSFPSDRKNLEALYQCYHCSQLDTGPRHWVNCEVYSEIIARKGLNINLDIDMIKLYREIFKMRTNGDS